MLNHILQRRELGKATFSDECSHWSLIMFFIEHNDAGAPVVASWPHFFDGDKEYVNQVVGLEPNQAKHETFIILEPVSSYNIVLCFPNLSWSIEMSHDMPFSYMENARMFVCFQNSGALLLASKRFQVNVALQPTKWFPQFKKIQKMLIPVLWADEVIFFSLKDMIMVKY